MDGLFRERPAQLLLRVAELLGAVDLLSLTLVSSACRAAAEDQADDTPPSPPNRDPHATHPCVAGALALAAR